MKKQKEPRACKKTSCMMWNADARAKCGANVPALIDRTEQGSKYHETCPDYKKQNPKSQLVAHAWRCLKCKSIMPAQFPVSEPKNRCRCMDAPGQHSLYWMRKIHKTWKRLYQKGNS